MTTPKFTIQQKTPMFAPNVSKWRTVLDEYNDPREFATEAEAQAWVDAADQREFEAIAPVAGRPEYRIVASK